MFRFTNIGSLLFVWFFFVTCDSIEPSVTYYAFKSTTSTQEWDANRPLTFHIDSISSSDTYAIKLFLRSLNTFPYQELWLSVTYQMEEPAFNKTDTISCSLVDEMGQLNGKGHTIYAYQYNLLSLKFFQGQKGTITVNHLMRKRRLNGIFEVGLRLQKE